MAKGFSHFLLLLVSLLVFGNAEVETTLANNGKVHELTESNFSASVRKYPWTFVEFYAPWCEACKQIEKEWERTAQVARTYDVPVGKLDVTTETGGTLAQELGIDSTPTLFLFKGHSNIRVKYSKHLIRDADNMADWLGQWIEGGQMVYQPEATKQGVTKDWAPQAPIKVLGLLSGDVAADHALEELLEAVGFMLNPLGPQAEIPVGAATLPLSDVTSLGVSCNSSCIVMFRGFQFEEQRLFVYEEAKTNVKLVTRIASFMTWFEPKKVPSLIRASEETEHIFMKENAKHGNALAVYFGQDANTITEVRRQAANYAPIIENLKWVHAAEDDFAKDIGTMVGVSRFPEFILWEFGKEQEDDLVFKLSKQEGLSALPSEDAARSIQTFIEGWQSRSLLADKDPVIAATSASFEDIVYDKSKDVLVEFYAPWCGHCKSLAPEYKQVAQHYQDDPGIAIVKMDSTVHSHSSVDVKSMPTLYIYTAAAKKSPILLKFESSRDRQSIIELVEKHRTTASANADDDDDEYTADGKRKPKSVKSSSGADTDDNDIVGDDDDERHPEF